MLALLKANEKSDLEIKQTCEADRMADTKKAIDTGRKIDEATDLVNQLKKEISTIQEEIEKLLAEHKKVKEELASATKIRKDQNAAWKVSDQEDKDAAKTVASAAAVLEGFYKDNKLVLAQVAKQPASQAGAAPPPPPPTWEGGYGGKTGESQGIVAVLDMIKADILQDQQTAKTEEDESNAAYSKFKKESDGQMKDLISEKNKQEKVKGAKELKVQDTLKLRATAKGGLDKVLEKIENINPHCEYFTVNYPLRLKNRQIEIDGLNKAKAILKGGTFIRGTSR
jgi:hypothetical protein